MRIGMALLLMLWLTEPGVARTLNLELAWSELQPEIQGKTVALLLPDGVRIEGLVQAVEPDALIMNVRKSSDRGLHPKGRTSVPFGSAGTIEMRGRRTKWQIIGPAIGAVPGIVACSWANTYANNESGSMNGALTAICVAPLGAGVGLGYMAGRAADKQVTYIKVKNTAMPKVAP
jgi:hypothetical protein